MITTETLFQRGVDTILPTPEQLAAALKLAKAEGRKLRVYLGVDPTSPHLHIGHTIPMRKLAHFQQAGHQAILLIGHFTTLDGLLEVSCCFAGGRFAMVLGNYCSSQLFLKRHWVLARL